MKKLFMICISALSLNVQAQLQNLGFEQWQQPLESFNNLPENWTIFSDHVYRIPSGQTYFPPVTDAQSGNLALRLSVWYTYTEDIAYQKAAIAGRPTALSGYYTYTRNFYLDGNTNKVEIDSARVWVTLTRWNAAAGKSDTVGRGYLALDSVPDYKQFVCPIVYSSSEMPDSIAVTLDPSLLDRVLTNHNSGLPEGISSFFTVDNLALSQDAQVGLPEQKTTALQVYPNPVKETLYITGTEETLAYEILDLSGKVQSRGSSAHKSIATGDLKPGVYLVQLRQGETVQRLKFVKQ